MVGVFVMHSALQGDRRLAIAGFRPGETVFARLVVLAAATALVVIVSSLATALYFTPASCRARLDRPYLRGNRGSPIGALAGVVLDKLSATYLMLFLVMTDLGIVQNPMFGDGTPDGWAVLLPGFGAAGTMVEGAFSPNFHAGGELALAAGWATVLAVIVFVVLRRAVGVRA